MRHVVFATGTLVALGSLVSGRAPIRGVFEPPQNQGESNPLHALDAAPADGTPPLERIRDFYLSAEAISAENLGRHFDELLERQRQLISAYFTEAPLQEDPR